MAGGMFHRRSDGSLVELQEAPFPSEDELQELIARHPRLLGDGLGEEPRRWLLVARELGVPREEGGGNWWSADHLFLDQDGVPTLVEVKRASDTRARREVVAQMLDYAANAVVYWPAETIRERFAARCERAGADADRELGELLDGAAEPAAFWQNVETNLRAGRIRMIFVADRIAPELQRIVEFLNEQMRPAEVLAVELRQYAYAGESTIVPRIIGRTVEAEQRKQVAVPRSPIVRDMQGFLELMLERNGQALVDVAECVRRWADARALTFRFGTGNEASMILVPPRGTAGQSLFSLWTGYTAGKARGEISLEYLKNAPPFTEREFRLEVLHRVNAATGAANPDRRADSRPTFMLNVLQDASTMQRFLETMDWVLVRLNEAAATDAPRA